MGWTLALNDAWKLSPQALLKYAPGAPFDGDLNVTGIFNDRFFGGATYRLGNGVTASAGESVDVLLGMQATEKIFFCFSYDIGLTPLRHYNNGTIEATLRYRFNPPAPDDAESTSPIDFLQGSEKKGKKKQ
ncbi:MAG TPA: type IX secretion system membrane protein PorP/SprF, partial [Saprospiraceae bacterium]|nr:type IX secretion system membrane protein PorP/SprF [Saprospiraceae bacterium]